MPKENSKETKAYVMSETGFIREKNLLPIVSVSHATLWRYVREGKFPAPVKLSANVTVWKIESVRAWIAAQGGV